MLKNRSVVAVIILSLVTFGIYNLYWVWVTARDLDNEGNNSLVPPVIQFILYLFTAYIGWIVFALCADSNINAIRAQRGLPQKDNKIIYIVLAIVLPIALAGLVQNDINELA